MTSTSHHAPGLTRPAERAPGTPLADPAREVAQRAAPDGVVPVSRAANDPLMLTGPPGTTGQIDAGLNDPGALLKAGRYPSGHRAVTSCSVI